MSPDVPIGTLKGGDEMSEPTRAYGPVEDSDATRLAQHSVSNDAPTDVNMNSIVARSQALTVDLAGKSFASNQDRRDKIADAVFHGEVKKP